MEPEISDESKLIIQPNTNIIDDNNITNKNYCKYSILIIIIVYRI